MYFVLYCRVLLAPCSICSLLFCLMPLLTINESSISYQASLLSCLSTAVGSVHEPPSWMGWQTCNSPILVSQCWAHGRWTDPNAHRHTAQLLDDSTSLPTLREQQHHHQLAHVGWPMANMKSHMKIAFSWEKNCSKCMTFAVQLTCQQQAVHHTITHHRRAGGLCPIKNEEHCACVANIHSIPREK